MMRHRQKGVALITIMLIVAVATILAVQMTNDQSVAVNRAISIFNNDQVEQYAYGGEELARQILFEDLKKQPTKDTHAQDWASNKLQFDFDEGHIDLKIEDLQGRLNLNSLVQAPQQGGQVARQRFLNLFSRLGVETSFVDRIIDWIDKNDAKLPYGAEDSDYLALDHPYRTAGVRMEDESELRLLLDMDKDSYHAIAPFVCALPDPATTINVNTASATVLQAIAPTLADDEAQTIVDVRDSGEGYDSPRALMGDPAFNFPAGIPQDGLGVQSSYFQVSVRAQYRDRFAYLTSIIQRNPADGSMRVIYRDLSHKIYPVVASN